MDKTNSKLNSFISNSLVQELFLTIVAFFYFLFQFRPTLLLEIQPPVFLMNTDFFIELLNAPGGITDWLAALIMQLWLSDFLASLILALFLFLVIYLTRKWLATLFSIRNMHTLQIIPAVFLIVLFSSYDFRLSVTISFIINLLCLNIIIRVRPKSLIIRTVIVVIVAGLLYWITAGAFLMFVVLYGFNDIFFEKRIVPSFLLIIIAGLLPYILSRTIILMTLQYAYFHNLSIESNLNLISVKYALIIFYLLVFFTAYLLRFEKIMRIVDSIKRIIRLNKISYAIKWFACTIFILVSTVFLIKSTFNKDLWLLLEVNKCVRENRWDDALKVFSSGSIVNQLLLCQANMALFESGELLNKLFSYPQYQGTKGLFMDYDWSTSWPEQASEISWKLGLVNESLHWAHEALEKRGPTSEILQKLGRVYMVKGEYKAAEKFLLNLMDVPFCKSTAERLLWLNKHPDQLMQDSLFKQIISFMPIEKAVLTGKTLSEKCEKLLKRNPNNKMAFEYMIACHLLNGNFRKVIEYIDDFEALGYKKIPRHVEEALLVTGVLDQRVKKEELDNLITPLTFRRFLKYQQILHNHKQNLNSAKYELQTQFSDTYWYYLMYIGRASKQAMEKQHEYQ